MPDAVITVYNQIITLLKAEPTLYDPSAGNKALIWPKNFVDFASTNPRPQKAALLAQGAKQDGDFPELMLDDGPYTDSVFTYMQTFANFGAQQPPRVWREKFTQLFTITLTMRDLQLAPATALRAAVGVALRKGGAKLGVPAVSQWGPLSSTSTRGASPSTGETLRRTMKITFPVVFSFDGNTQLI